MPRNLAGKLLNEPGLPERQCIVIRVEREEEVGHASAVLLDTKLGCFQGMPYPGVGVLPLGLS